MPTFPSLYVTSSPQGNFAGWGEAHSINATTTLKMTLMLEISLNMSSKKPGKTVGVHFIYVRVVTMEIVYDYVKKR